MSGGLLSNLPPLDKSSGRMVFARKIKLAPKPKKPFTMPNVKKVAKLLKDLGKEVADVTVNGDGGFTVTAADPAHAEKTSYWDKVLDK